MRCLLTNSSHWQRMFCPGFDTEDTRGMPQEQNHRGRRVVPWLIISNQQDWAGPLHFPKIKSNVQQRIQPSNWKSKSRHVSCYSWPSHYIHWSCRPTYNDCVSIFLIGFATSFLKQWPPLVPYAYGLKVMLYTFCLIIVSGYRMENPLKTALDRLYSIAIGAVVAVLVNVVVYPMWAWEQLQKELVNSFDSMVESLQGFDVVEIHGVHGYQLEPFMKFMKDEVNDQVDEYGGTLENRCRFPLKVVEAVNEIGAGKVEIRFSPFGNSKDSADSNPESLGLYMIKTLNKYEIAYCHMVEPRMKPSGEMNEVPFNLLPMRKVFNGTFIVAGGYDKEEGNKASYCY